MIYDYSWSYINVAQFEYTQAVLKTKFIGKIFLFSGVFQRFRQKCWIQGNISRILEKILWNKGFWKKGV